MCLKTKVFSTISHKKSSNNLRLNISIITQDVWKEDFKVSKLQLTIPKWVVEWKFDKTTENFILSSHLLSWRHEERELYIPQCNLEIYVKGYICPMCDTFVSHCLLSEAERERERNEMLVHLRHIILITNRWDSLLPFKICGVITSFLFI